MKKLTYMTFALVLLAAIGCRRNKTIQYVRVVQDSAAAAANDVGGLEEVEGYIDDTDGLFEIPDIPEERGVNMRASDDELERIMRGEE